MPCGLRWPICSADGTDNRGTALLLELPDRASADASWNEEPFVKNADISAIRASPIGCLGIDEGWLTAA
jgi:hypothetical protein